MSDGNDYGDGDGDDSIPDQNTMNQQTSYLCGAEQGKDKEMGEINMVLDTISQGFTLKHEILGLIAVRL